MQHLTVTTVSDLQQWFDKNPTRLVNYGLMPKPYDMGHDKLSPLMLSGYNRTQRAVEHLNDEGEPLSAYHMMEQSFDLCDIQADSFETCFDLTDYFNTLD